MKQTFLENYPHVILNGIALFLFLFSFIAITVQALRRKSKELYSIAEKLPLEDSSVRGGNHE